MIVGIGGVNICTEIKEICTPNTKNVDNKKPNIIVEFLENHIIPNNLTFITEFDDIKMYKQFNDYYFFLCGSLILKIEQNNDIWTVMVKKDISAKAINEILIKKILPLYCYNTCIALPLHCTAVKKHKNLLCFSGFSKSGKSTLAACMISNNKYSLVSDDVLYLFYNNDKVYTFPTYSNLKLREDSFKIFNDKIGNFRSMDYNPLNINNLIIISNEVSDEIIIEKISERKNEYLLQNLFANSLCEYSLNFLKLFYCVKNNVALWKLKYPRNYSVLPQVCEMLETEFKGDCCE